MHYLRHSWFDPTSLSSRNVAWDVLSGNSDKDSLQVQAYRSALLAENDAAEQPVWKRRGRQRMAEQPIVLQQYPDTLVDSIGVWGNDEEVHALYSVQAGVPVALVGLRVEKDSESLHAYLDAMYVLPHYRRRGLGSAIAQHAGEWAVLGMWAWRDGAQKLSVHAQTQNVIEAALAQTFFRSAMETAQLHGIEVPSFEWGIVGDGELSEGLPKP